MNKTGAGWGVLSVANLCSPWLFKVVRGQSSKPPGAAPTVAN